jgi:hypothetical protein
MTGAEARGMASWIAFAPILFQASRSLRDLGILGMLLDNRSGLTLDEIAEKAELTRYGAAVLLDLAASVGIVNKDGDRFVANRVSRYLEVDEMTRVNMDFVQDVCYAGMADLTEAITTGTPAGLHALGTDEPTIYTALKSLPEPVRKSWFSFDHYYSDASFRSAVKHVVGAGAKRLMDIGGNTGKFARCYLESGDDLRTTIVDLPGQLQDAEDNLSRDGLIERTTLYTHNLLDGEQRLPEGCDGVWLSQVLDCFSEEEILVILRKVVEAVEPGTDVWILEPLWDRQKYAAAEMSLHCTSLYFTALANGNSRFYDLVTMQRLVEASGLEVVEIIDGLGTGHTLMHLRRA